MNCPLVNIHRYLPDTEEFARMRSWHRLIKFMQNTKVTNRSSKCKFCGRKHPSEKKANSRHSAQKSLEIYICCQAYAIDSAQGDRECWQFDRWCLYCECSLNKCKLLFTRMKVDGVDRKFFRNFGAIANIPQQTSASTNDASTAESEFSDKYRWCLFADDASISPNLYAAAAPTRWWSHNMVNRVQKLLFKFFFTFNSARLHLIVSPPTLIRPRWLNWVDSYND